MKPGDRILVDTMIIIEAYRSRCWAALASTFRVETVDMCVVECATGRRLRRNFQPIEDADLRRRLAAIHQVDELLRAALVTSDRLAGHLDAGELDLIACAMAQKEAWLMCTSDRAALGCLHRLGFLYRTVSLEGMADRAGWRGSEFPPNFGEKWLSKVRTELQTEDLP